MEAGSPSEKVTWARTAPVGSLTCMQSTVPLSWGVPLASVAMTVKLPLAAADEAPWAAVRLRTLPPANAALVASIRSDGKGSRAVNAEATAAEMHAATAVVGSIDTKRFIRISRRGASGAGPVLRAYAPPRLRARAAA